MLNYLIKRLLLMGVTLFGITLITFVATRLTPGDPAAAGIQPGSSGRGAQAVGYEDLVEQNRRNLGLDKPLLINTNFEDREFAAERAIDDLFKSQPMWQKIGEKTLARTNTIALKAALDRYPLIGTPQEPLPKDSRGRNMKARPVEERKAVLASWFPKLALETNLGQGLAPDASYEFWSAWYEANKARYGEERVEQVVQAYLSGSAPLDEVRTAGGFAVPALIAALGNERTSRLANDGLSAITTFNFLTNPDSWDAERSRILERWRSYYSREQVRYSTYGPVRHGLNILLNTQYGIWVKQTVTFDFGESYREKRPVREMIAERLPISFSLSVASIIFSYLLSIPIGIFSAVKRYSAPDRVITVILFLLYSLPSFWVATMLILTTTGGPNFPELFPTRGLNSPEFVDSDWTLDMLRDRIWHMVLPVTVLTYGSLAFISRQMRSAMLETIKQDFVRTAQAKGLAEHVVIFKHALRNSLIPIITISAGILPELIAGAIIVESIFTIRGMGTLTLDSIVNRDYPVINAVLFFSALLTLLGILVADILYAVVDPRISYE
ncbi:MAG: ABC transporter permease subunit [Candidatus Sumerlaeia bacterium]|nr:ABC transporter permease subunit [Candidatus Sumerlaeia bacterium]